MTLIETALDGLDVAVEGLEYTTCGVHAQAEVRSDLLRPVCRALHSLGFFLETVTAIDWLADGIIQGVYLFNHYGQNTRFKLTIRTERAQPVFPSVGAIYPGAVWHERETGEFFGITYKDIPDSRCLLLPAETTFHPLRKDFRPQQAQPADTA